MNFVQVSSLLSLLKCSECRRCCSVDGFHKHASRSQLSTMHLSSCGLIGRPTQLHRCSFQKFVFLCSLVAFLNQRSWAQSSTLRSKLFSQFCEKNYNGSCTLATICRRRRRQIHDRRQIVTVPQRQIVAWRHFVNDDGDKMTPGRATICRPGRQARRQFVSWHPANFVARWHFAGRDLTRPAATYYLGMIFGVVE